MEFTRQIEARRQRLLEKVRRSNSKSARLQRKIQREMEKRSPQMTKVMKWQEKSAKYVNRGLRYMNEFDALAKGNHEETAISFNLEKVHVYNFKQMLNASMKFTGQCK